MTAPPTYPVRCRRCGVAYGPGAALGSHRPGSAYCLQLQAVRPNASAPDARSYQTTSTPDAAP